MYIQIFAVASILLSCDESSAATEVQYSLPCRAFVLLIVLNLKLVEFVVCCQWVETGCFYIQLFLWGLYHLMNYWNSGELTLWLRWAMTLLQAPFLLCHWGFTVVPLCSADHRCTCWAVLLQQALWTNNAETTVTKLDLRSSVCMPLVTYRQDRALKNFSK